ncbi:hypothetical protein [Lachnospira sp.]|uniref:hypothetical protein n=1 Tax=Lachnospira sp. TaxID=2049031 RepID=UPI00257C4BA9|nr:hypothetical protein [Lachnospira sp.]
MEEYNSDKGVLFSVYDYCRSAIALAKISQKLLNDPLYGGIITKEEWDSDIMKYTILRLNNDIVTDENDSVFRVLAFHTPEQRDLFLKENINLIKDYFML